MRDLGTKEVPGGVGWGHVIACLVSGFRPCLVPKKFYKIFQISRHIESLDAYIEY